MAEAYDGPLARSVTRRIHPICATEAAIQAIPPGMSINGRLVIALAELSPWVYDAASTAVAAANVLVPTDARSTGRWRRVDSLASVSKGSVSFNLYGFREVDATGDVSNIAGNGGILAADTTPIQRGAATTNEAEIFWATGNADPIGISFALPADFDDAADATLDLFVASGSTDAATMGIASTWNGGAEVTDSADDASTKSATAHTITATIATADIPTGANRVTFRITPPTHATNGISLFGARLNYRRKYVAG